MESTTKGKTMTEPEPTPPYLSYFIAGCAIVGACIAPSVGTVGLAVILAMMAAAI